MCLMRRMHVSPIERLHGKRGKVVEAIIVLDRRMVVRIVSTVSVPSRVLILKRFLVVVVVLVVHLQLAHVELQQTYRSRISV
jgi:hypothetical protein